MNYSKEFKFKNKLLNVGELASNFQNLIDRDYSDYHNIRVTITKELADGSTSQDEGLSINDLNDVCEIDKESVSIFMHHKSKEMIYISLNGSTYGSRINVSSDNPSDLSNIANYLNSNLILNIPLSDIDSNESEEVNRVSSKYSTSTIDNSKSKLVKISIIIGIIASLFFILQYFGIEP